jgi:hypothetical protein
VSLSSIFGGLRLRRSPLSRIASRRGRPGAPGVTDTRGTTIAEYAVLLFMILVIGAIAVKVLGMTIEKKVGQANKHMTGQGGQTSSAGGSSDNAPASTAGASGAGAGAKPSTTSGDVGKDPTAAGGGGEGKDDDSQQGGLPIIVKFALIALGVIGAAAAFFAMSKNKPAGG